MRVLVTDGQMDKSLAVVRAIEGYASFVGVTSKYPVSVAGVSRHADASYWLRNQEPEAYVERFNEIAREAEIDQLLPVGGGTFEVVSEHRDELDLPVETLLPPREAMDVAVTKSETYETAERVGIPTPTTTTVTAEADVERAGERVGYPAVLKTNSETAGRFVRVARSPADLRAAYADHRDADDADPIVQEYLPGASRGFFGLFVDGELVDGYSHRRIREYPPEGGASACAVSTRDDELAGYADRLLSELDWHGVAMVEFKESSEGVPTVVEINPKFWGSLDLGIASGFNFPRALLEYTAGRREFSFEFVPRSFHWPLWGDLMHVSRRPDAAGEVLEDLLSPHVESNLELADPAPHVVEALVTLLRRDL